jgi:hypothetical protein
VQADGSATWEPGRGCKSMNDEGSMIETRLFVRHVNFTQSGIKGSSTPRWYPWAMQPDPDNADLSAPRPNVGGRSVEPARPIEPVRAPEVQRVLEPARRPVPPRA